MVQSIPLLRKIRQANEHWFSPSNKRFFGDVNYMAFYGGKTGASYLVQKTNAWTDMLGRPKKLHYRIHELNQLSEEIGHLLDEEFETLADVKAWLREN
jgi:hypothetical protein